MPILTLAHSTPKVFTIILAAMCPKSYIIMGPWLFYSHEIKQMKF